MRCSRLASILFTVLAVATMEARAQFTSQYSTVYLPGTFNGYDTLNSGMRLISNDVWQSYVRITNATGAAFLFSNYTFGQGSGNVWKETNQSQFGVPMSGVAELNAGSDISMTGTVSGVFRVRFDDVSGAYSVTRATYGTPPTGVFVNEFHYDNDGTDVNEGIEIAGPAGSSLTNYAIVKYAGSTGNTYGTNVLSGALTNGTQSGIGVKFFAISGLQNGSPDGFALVDRSTTNVLYFLSYEGIFQATNGPAAGLASTDIGLMEDNPVPAVDYSLQLAGSGASYNDFYWTGPVLNSRDQINSNQFVLAGPTASSVVFSNATASPVVAFTNQALSFKVNVSGQNGASNISVTTFYRFGTAGSYQPLAMTNLGNTYSTVSNIGPQPDGTKVSYYFWANFDGPGINTPALFPANAPSSVFGTGFSKLQLGQVWINEIDPVMSIFTTTNTSEFVELAGIAAANIGGWTIEMIDQYTNTYATYTIPSPTLIPNNTNGFGFYLLGSTGTPNARIVFTNLPAGNEYYMADSGALRLYDSFGAVEQAFSYGSANSLSGFTYIGDDPTSLSDEDGSIALIGTGSNLNNFVWSTNTPPTANRINTNEFFVGGNTNPIAPGIQCPADRRLPCPTNAIPPIDTALVGATGYCGSGSVTVTWVSDATNAGTGCKGNAKIVTRTYKAVSTCGTTSTCSQLIILEDTNAPFISVPTQTLVNASFENGSLIGWNAFGPVTNESVNIYEPHSGVFHALIAPGYNNICRDITGNGFDGAYSNGVLRDQAPMNTNLGYSATFDGVNDYVNIPALNLSNNTATMTTWFRRSGEQSNYTGLVFWRGGGSGLGFSTANQLGYNWNNNTNTYLWSSGIVPPDSNWVFAALSVDPTRAVLYMCSSNQWFIATNDTDNAISTFNSDTSIGRDPTAGRFFRGSMDDVQFYARTLSFSEISNVWNGGQGGATTNGLLARWTFDEFFPGSTQLGIYQDLAAKTGQTWNAGIWAKPAADNRLQGTNKLTLALQFLNATNGVVSTTNSTTVIDRNSSTSTYVRLFARRVAPSNTVAARLLVTYQQDVVGTPGIVYLDDAFLSDTLITAGTNVNQCGTMPNYLTNILVGISDDCTVTGSIVKTQSPAAGSQLTNGTIAVTITATDGCGNSTQATFNAFVDDTTRPVASVQSTNLTCSSLSYATNLTVSDNCPGWFVSFISATTNSGTGCPASPIVITNTYLVTDIGGNTTAAVQVVTIADTVAPSASLSIPALNNGDFEAGVLTTNWQTFGVNTQVVSIAPHGGTSHVKLSGVTNGTVNYTGIYQTLAAQYGQSWRLGAWIMTPTNEPIGAANWLESKIEFLDGSQSIIETDYAQNFAAGTAPAGLYRQVAVSAIAPFNAAFARATFAYVQSNNAPGTVFIDDASLSRTIYSGTNSCGAIIGDLSGIASAIDCSFVTITQSPPAGATATLGTNIVRFYSVDACGNSATSALSVVVVDDVPPVISAILTNVTVATTNGIPAPNPGAVSSSVFDACSPFTVTNLPDVRNGGDGSSTNPLIITRLYLARDTWGNGTITQQIITVNSASGVPPAPTNITVASLNLGVTIGGTNVIRSTGTNTWSVLPEYVTNLLGSQIWQAVSNYSTIWSNGTNVTSFTIPTNALPAFIRIKQTYP